MMFTYLLITALLCSPAAWCAVSREKLIDEFYPDNIKPEFVTRCYGDLGCFYTGPPFYHPRYLPVTVPPANDTVTKYYLFTPDNPEEKYELELTTDSIKNSKFDGNNPLKVLIHGYERQDLTDFYNMKDALLKDGKYNVIVVDWTHDNGSPLWQAIANARLNGAKISQLLKLLMKSSALNSSDIHLIGHSLGAQIAGWVGMRIKRIARISALDPAGVYFHKAPASVRLDYSDAVFIDVLHTNGGRNVVEGLGAIEPIGHINFYPNGGTSQPGCDSEDLIKNTTEDDVVNSCDHNRSVNLYTYTIDNSECRFLAVQCSSYKRFMEGACLPMNSVIREMGFHTKNIGRVRRGAKFYLTTSGQPPYCQQHGYIA